MKRIVTWFGVGLLLSLGSSGCGDVVIPPPNGTDIVVTADARNDIPTGACSIDQDCPQGEPCQAGVCEPGTGQCTLVVDDGACFVDGVCLLDGQEEAGNRCRICSPSLSQEAFVNKQCPDGQSCSPVSGECSSAPVLLQPGDSCAQDEQCASGACIEGPSGLECAAPCDAGDCPVGSTCGDLNGLQICFSGLANVCKPCAADNDCQDTPGTTGATCVTFPEGAGSFCGAACSTDADCGDGHTCNAEYQCVPIDFVCTCRPTWEGLSTACGVGACEGTRSCASEALSACDGATPGVEVCNAVDDNCDGVTDEPFLVDGVIAGPDDCGACGVACVGTVANGTTQCVVVSGAAVCELTACDAGYIPSAGACIPEPSDVAVCTACADNAACGSALDCVAVGEVSVCLEPCTNSGDCDTGAGFECRTLGSGSYCAFAGGGCASQGSACDGTTLCFDGDPCTDGACDNGSCVFSQSATGTPCDDGDLCTTSDACDDTGACVGTPGGCECETVQDCLDAVGANAPCVTAACDDNVCAYTLANDAGPCDDGDPCTSESSCQAGVCKPGQTLDCSALDDACNTGVCVGGSCVAEPQPCTVESFHWHTPSVALDHTPASGVGLCGAGGHSTFVGTADSGSGFSIHIGFVPTTL